MKKALYTLGITLILALCVSAGFSLAQAERTGPKRLAVVNHPDPDTLAYVWSSLKEDAAPLFGYYNGVELVVFEEYENGWASVSIGPIEGYMKTESLIIGAEAEQGRNLPILQVINPKGTKWTNFRDKPKMESTVIDQYPTGQEVTLLGVSDEWYQVFTNSTMGFIKCEFLEDTGKTGGYIMGSPAPYPAKTPTTQKTATGQSNTSGMSMRLYTEAPNPKSTVSIEYPYFEGNDALNAMIYRKIQSILEYPASYYPQFGFTAEYQAAVTLNNSKMVSIVFWGDVLIEKGRPGTVLKTLNINLSTMKEVALANLYIINTDFETALFSNGYFPSKPATSYNESDFSEILMLQMPENNPNGAFRFLDEVQCFLKPDGIVISLASINGTTGIDRFEVQANYSDLQHFYLPSTRYWEK